MLSDLVICSNPWLDSDAICAGCKRNTSDQEEEPFMPEYADLAPQLQVPVEEGHCRSFTERGS